jgi:hypothetical protein
MMEVWPIFFSSFFLTMAAVGAGAVMMSAASPSCCNVYLLHLHHPSPPSHSPVTAPCIFGFPRCRALGAVLQ